MEQNIQLYGRNDMVMLQDNKIYGSLGLAEKYIVKTKQGTPPLLLDSSLKSKFLGMNIYGKSTQDGIPTPENPAEIKSVENPVVTVRGKNLFDSKLLQENNEIMNFVQIKVPNGIYTLSSNIPRTFNGDSCYIFFISGYKSDIVGISSDSNGVNDGVSRTVESVDGYVTIAYRYKETVNHFSDYWYQIEKGTVVTEYEPYTEQLAIFHYTLNGIPVSSGGNYTDGNGQQWVCDVVDFERGVYIRNIVSRTFDGSAIIDSNGGIVNGFFRCQVSFPEIPNKTVVDGICDKFIKGVGDMERFNLGYRTFYLWIDISRLNGENSTLDDVKIFMNNNPITVYAKREIPVEEPLTEEELTAYKALHSNYPSTVVDNSEQAEMSVTYKSFENA